MKEVEMVKAFSLYNELHIILTETGDRSKKSMCMLREQVKHIMKSEAAKPLFILREE